MYKDHVSKPIQLIKKAYGLRGSENNCDLTLVEGDLTLMDMDAPSSLPAGSTVRREPLPDTDPGYFLIAERTCYRPGAFR